MTHHRSLPWAAIPLSLATSIFLISADDCSSDPECPSCVADFAIYDPDYENDGVWEEEVDALKTMLDAYGYTWSIVDHTDLNNQTLGAAEDRRFKALLAPGGYAFWRNRAVNEAGEAGVLAFVESGGGYVGFCAGTFWTADSVLWAQEATGGGGAFNDVSDYNAVAYDLGLMEGVAQGPFGWTPWEEGLGVSLQLAEIDTSVAAMAAISIPAETRFFYYGGPVFSFDVPPPGLEVWARAKAPPGLPTEALTGNGEPTVIRYGRGDGEVVLFSYHPEVLVNSDADGLVMAYPVDETEVPWETGSQSWEEINLQSWNIVHAALQVAVGEVVTPITALP